MSLKKSLLISSGVLFTIILLQSVLTFFVMQSQDELQSAQENRYLSYMLADELRQSSDDLTRLARTYVLTGNEQYEKMYWDILAIRNGEKPRPQHAERIYWDLVLEYGQKPREDGETIALEELMKQAGFTEEEFEFLHQAQANSDGLVQTETIAMNAMKGLFQDESGNFTLRKEPNPQMAQRIMHDLQYHREKAKIMQPIDQFFGKFNERTAESVKNKHETLVLFKTSFLLLFIVLLLLSIFIGFYIFRTIFSQIGGEPKVVAEVAERVARGNLFTFSPRNVGDSSIFSSMLRMAQHLTQVITNIFNKANEVSTIAHQLSESSEQLSNRTTEQASAIEEVSASMSKLKLQTANNSQIAANASLLANTTRQATTENNQQMQTMVKAMMAINHSSQNISKIIKVIEEIAFQTNLLALNAAVEAARAGVHGKGFAVVANEVRSLSVRSSQAAQETAELIENSVAKAEEGTHIANQTAESLQEIVGQIGSVTDLITEIAEASQEQAEGIDQTTENMKQLEYVTQENLANAQEGTAISHLLFQHSKELKSILSHFKLPSLQANPSKSGTLPPSPASLLSQPQASNGMV